MRQRRINSHSASALSVVLSIGLVSISAILLAVAATTNARKAPAHDPYGFQLEDDANADSIRALGNYPDTSIPLSTNISVTPDVPPTNTTSVNISTSTNFKRTLA